MAQQKKGNLFLVATPIGNLEDITLRAIRVLGEVDLIAAEDTRRTLKLLSHFKISKPITSYFEGNKFRKAPLILKKLEEGFNVALTSDAGMPGISDPGYHLVNAAIERGIQIVPIPGPTALIAALAASGLPTDRFVFEGFLPHKASKRKRKLQELAAMNCTIVLFESPRRLLRTLNELIEIAGDRRAALARELTKKFEEIIRGSLKELAQRAGESEIRGEVTLVIGPEEASTKQQDR